MGSSCYGWEKSAGKPVCKDDEDVCKQVENCGEGLRLDVGGYEIAKQLVGG